MHDQPIVPSPSGTAGGSAKIAPMTLVISDEAVALLTASSPEATEARCIVERIAQYGRGMGIGIEISPKTLAGLTGGGAGLRAMVAARAGIGI